MGIFKRHLLFFIRAGVFVCVLSQLTEFWDIDVFDSFLVRRVLSLYAQKLCSLETGSKSELPRQKIDDILYN